MDCLSSLPEAAGSARIGVAPRSPTSLRLSPNLYDRLERMAHAEHRSLANLIQHLLSLHMEGRAVEDKGAITRSITRHANYATYEVHHLKLITGYIIEKMTKLVALAEQANITREELMNAFLLGVRSAEDTIETDPASVNSKYSTAVRTKLNTYAGPYYDTLSMGLGALDRASRP